MEFTPSIFGKKYLAKKIGAVGECLTCLKSEAVSQFSKSTPLNPNN